MTLSVTFTVKEPVPIVKVTFPVYVPAGSFAFRFEAVMVTFAVAPPFNVLPVGLANNQFPPLAVCVAADQVPGGPQFVIAIACVAGSLLLATPVNVSAAGVPLTHPACTVKEMFNVSVTLFDWLLKVTAAV